MTSTHIQVIYYLFVKHRAVFMAAVIRRRCPLSLRPLYRNATRNCDASTTSTRATGYVAAYADATSSVPAV